MTRARWATTAFVVFSGLMAALVTYLYATWSPSGRVRHNDFLAPDTAVRAVTQPAKIQGYISGLAPTATRFVSGIPRLSSTQPKGMRIDWVHTLPHEFTLLFDQQAPEALGVALFVSEHPESNDFAGVVNGSAFFGDLRFVQWTPPQLLTKDGGVLVARGAISVPVPVQERVATAWPGYVPLEAPPISGKHLVEIAVDNRNGALMEIHGALMRAYRAWGDVQLHEDLMAIWPDILRANVTADLTQDDELTIHVHAECVSQPESVPETIDALAHDLATLGSLQLDGSTHWETHLTAQGHYRVSGFESRLRRALGT